MDNNRNFDTSPGNQELFKHTFEKFIRKEQDKTDALKDPFHYLYRDLTAKNDLGLDFRSPLGERNFSIAEKHAKGCIEISPKVIEIKEGTLGMWVISALNCFNVPIAHYINTNLTKVPDYYDGHGKSLGLERASYRFLQESKIDDEKEVGRHFDMIYTSYRTTNSHVMVKDQKGIIRITEPLSENRYKRCVMKWFRGGLNPLLRLYKKK